MTETIIPQNLIDDFRSAKSALKASQDTLQKVEIEIYKTVQHVLPEKGTTHFGEMKIVTGMTEKWEQDVLQKVYEDWTANVAFPFKREFKAVAKDVSYVREHAPEAYGKIADALTLTPRKPSFEIKE